MSEHNHRFCFRVYDEDFGDEIRLVSHDSDIDGVDEFLSDGDSYMSESFGEMLGIIKECGKVISVKIGIPMCYTPPFMKYDTEAFYKSATKNGFQCVNHENITMSISQTPNEQANFIEFSVDVPESAVKAIAEIFS